METVSTLKDLAMDMANNQMPPSMESEIPTPEEAVARSQQKDVSYIGDTPVIIAPSSKNSDNPMSDLMRTPTPVPSVIGLDMDTLQTPVMNTPLDRMTPPGINTLDNPNMQMSDATLTMLGEIMPDLSVEQRVELARPIIETKPGIVKDLIINMGFTQEEAQTAADNQIRKKISEKYSDYRNNIETTAVVTINKTDDPNNLGLTKEEHMKLEKVKKVRLVVVEDMELANIKIERPDEEYKADYVKSIEGSLSKYSVPMPMLGDFVSFRGAQMVQMVNIVNYDDARLDEIINTKASLIYEKLISGNILQKYDFTGKSIMSYQEFANKFPYQDIDMALYGILCASSMEENSTSLTCQACSHEWMQTYNLKSLLKLDTLSDAFKERVDRILNYKSNDIEMRKLYESMRKASRFKSPFTNNIYDLSYPSIARATNLLKRINSEDTVMTYLSAIALYVSQILVYNASKDTYIEITADETSLMLETMKTLSNEDVNMLAKQIRDDLYYTPNFVLPAQCPSCGKKSDIPVSVEHLIFLTAQDSMVEIDS